MSDLDEMAAKAADARIGARVRAMRESRGWSLRDFAAEAKRIGVKGLSYSKVSQMEHARRQWSTLYAARFARVLDVDVETILGG